MCRKKFTVIGISDSHRQYFRQDVLEIIGKSQIFSGGKRHREIMMPHLPENHEWIDITVPLRSVLDKYAEHNEVTVFASGDPLFYGFASTLGREFPDAEIIVYPAFNSLQMLAHKTNLAYQDMRCTSLTGRPWKNFDDALISDFPLIGCLTDKNKGPAEIANRMLEYGYDNYEITIGVNLGNEVTEEVITIPLAEAAHRQFGNPNCVILKSIGSRKRHWGIPEKEFHHLQGRDNMITKMPVRLLSLSMLDLSARRSFWDIGFCTGSVSIEARLHFPHLDVTSFEIREESRNLMELNTRKFGTPSILYVIGDFLKQDLSQYERPDAVFIGGHGGKLAEMLEKLNDVILPGCVIVFNSVSTDSCVLFRDAVKKVGKTIREEHIMKIDSFNPITILKAQ